MSSLVALDEAEAWAYVLELADGLRVRRDRRQGQRVMVRLPGKADVWLFVTHVTELPPIVWVMMARPARTHDQ